MSDTWQALWEALEHLTHTFSPPEATPLLGCHFLLNLQKELCFPNYWPTVSDLICEDLGVGCVIVTVNIKSTVLFPETVQYPQSAFEKLSQEAWPRASDSLGWHNNNRNWPAVAFDLVKGQGRTEKLLAVNAKELLEWAWLSFGAIAAV